MGYSYDRRTAAKKNFEIGDLVRPSRKYLRAIGPTKIKDGLIKGKSGRFFEVQWNVYDDVMALPAEALEIDPRNDTWHGSKKKASGASSSAS